MLFCFFFLLFSVLHFRKRPIRDKDCKVAMARNAVCTHLSCLGGNRTPAQMKNENKKRGVVQ